MMIGFSFRKIASILNGKILVFGKDRRMTKIISNSKYTVPHCLFLLRLDIKNEEAFIARMIEKQVSGIILKHPTPNLLKLCKKAGIGVIQVKDSLDAMYTCAAIQRATHHIPFIQVIGSSGKTTTKEMISTVLNEKMSVVKTEENFNAPSEIAKKILRLKPTDEAAVMEVGMTEPIMMKQASRMIRPDIAVVTTIHRAHITRFGSIENIIAAKAQMLPYLAKHGTLIINGDNENCKKFLQKYKGRRVLKFGFSKDCDLRASNIVYKKGKTSFKVDGMNMSFNCSINTFGKYNVANALATILVGLTLKMDIDTIVHGLSKFTPVEGRLEVLEGMNGVTIVNDNYNANPDSTHLLLENIRDFAKKRPVVLVLGDMENPDEENRDYAREVHYWIGKEACKVGFNQMIAIGKWAQEYVNGAQSLGIQKEKLHYFRTVKEAEPQMKEFITPKSVVIFKSSPYVKVRRLIPFILD